MNTADFHSAPSANATRNVMVPLDGGMTLIGGMPVQNEAQYLRAFGKAPELVASLSPNRLPMPKQSMPSPADLLDANDLTDDYQLPVPRFN